MKFFHPESKENLILTLKHNLAHDQLTSEEVGKLLDRLVILGWREVYRGEPFFSKEELRKQFDDLIEEHGNMPKAENVEHFAELFYESGRTNYLLQFEEA